MTRQDPHLTRLKDPAIRGQVIVVIASLAVMFTILSEVGSPTGAGVPMLCGIAGLLLRWTAMPVALIFTLAYFQYFPIGMPLPMPSSVFDGYPIATEYVMLSAALLAYLAAQYRIFVHTAPVANTEVNQPAGEFDWLGSTASIFIAVAAAHGMWWLVNNLDFDLSRNAPLQWRASAGAAATTLYDSMQVRDFNRFLLLSYLMLLVYGVGQFVVWYARQRCHSQLEASMIVNDIGWRCQRREITRMEIWRSARLGHDQSRRSTVHSTFRWAVRAIVLLNMVGFLVWIAYIYFSYR